MSEPKACQICGKELGEFELHNHLHCAEYLLSRAEKAEAKVGEWRTVAEMLADELNDANSERFPISWEDASESSPAWIAYTNLRDRNDDE